MVHNGYYTILSKLHNWPGWLCKQVHTITHITFYEPLRTTRKGAAGSTAWHWTTSVQANSSICKNRQVEQRWVMARKNEEHLEQWSSDQEPQHNVGRITSLDKPSVTGFVWLWATNWASCFAGKFWFILQYLVTIFCAEFQSDMTIFFDSCAQFSNWY